MLPGLVKFQTVCMHRFRCQIELWMLYHHHAERDPAICVAPVTCKIFTKLKPLLLLKALGYGSPLFCLEDDHGCVMYQLSAHQSGPGSLGQTLSTG